MRFDGKVALITAAASGIGRASADIIAREGGTVVLVDNDKGRLEAATASLEAAGGRARTRQADALDPERVGRRAELRRLAAADRLQPRGHLPLLSHGDADHA